MSLVPDPPAATVLYASGHPGTGGNLGASRGALLVLLISACTEDSGTSGATKAPGIQQGMIYLADIGADNPLKLLQAASCTYRIAFGARASDS